jgi:hypothetical protein
LPFQCSSIEKALDEQLFFEAFRTARSGRASISAGECEAAAVHSGVEYRDFGLIQ